MVERVSGWRVVADPASLDELSGVLPVSPPAGGRAGEAGRGVVFRLAPDDALVLGQSEIVVSDPDAIVEWDSGWVSLPLTEESALDAIAANASWKVPPERPILLQGMLTGLPAKVYLDGGSSMIIVAAPFGHELEERLGS